MFPCTKLRMAGIFYIQLRLDASAASMRLEVLQLLKTFTLLLLSLSLFYEVYLWPHQWCDVYYCIPHISEIRDMILILKWSCLGKNTTSKFAIFREKILQNLPYFGQIRKPKIKHCLEWKTKKNLGRILVFVFQT